MKFRIYTDPTKEYEMSNVAMVDNELWREFLDKCQKDMLVEWRMPHFIAMSVTRYEAITGQELLATPRESKGVK